MGCPPTGAAVEWAVSATNGPLALSAAGPAITRDSIDYYLT
jgi:hypothetical protein